MLATTPNLHDQDRLYFTVSSNRLHNNFQGWGLRAGEWREGGERLDALFDRLAQALNSNEQFKMDDSFQLSITQVHHAPQGTGKPHRGKPGHPKLQTLTRNSKSIIRINNKDELCCARALVTAKARLDQHPKWESIRHGRKIQKELALLLHHEANVPFGPCSYDALTKFSAASSLAHYQIILVDAHRSFHISTFGGTQDKQLILLHHQGHYDVINLGFLDPVMYVPTVGNPITPRESIDAPRKSNAGPVAKKIAPTSFNVATRVIRTFSETRVSKHIWLLTMQANPPAAPSPPSAFFAVAVLNVVNRTSDLKRFKGIGATTWIVLLAMSTWTVKPIDVSFKEPQSLKKRRERENVKEVLAPNEGPRPRGFKPSMHRRRRRSKTTMWTTAYQPCTCFLTLKPCNPTNSTSRISSWPKPKKTINLFASKVTTVPAISWNGWIPLR